MLCTVVLEFWKRKQNESAMRWGMTDYESEEIERHEFEGIDIDSPVTGDIIKYYPTTYYIMNIFASTLVTSGLIAVVLLTLVALILLKIQLRSTSSFYVNGVELGGILVPAIQAAVMVVRNTTTVHYTIYCIMYCILFYVEQ
jgi:hypothetical protein